MGAVGSQLAVVITSGPEILSGKVTVFVCCWLVAESCAWNVRLSPFFAAVGVPESSPEVDSVSPVPASEPPVSVHFIVPVPPVEVSWSLYATPTFAVGNAAEVIASATGLATKITLAEVAVAAVGVALSVAKNVTAFPAAAVGEVGVPVI